MHGPGDSLKQEREARGRTIEEIAEATGIRPHLLAALEQEAFDALPGRGFGKLYIRAYAEVLGFDPRPVIEAYDHALRARQTAAPDPAPANAPRPLKAALARWRQERMAERAAADRSGEPEEDSIEAEDSLEEVALLEEARPEADGDPDIEAEPPGNFAGAAEAEPDREAVEQGTAPEVLEDEVLEEPGIRSAPLPPAPAGERIEAAPPLPLEAVSPTRPVRSRRWLLASLLLFVLLPPMAWLVFSGSTPGAPPAAVRREPAPAEPVAPPPSRPAPPRAAEPPRTPPRAEKPGGGPGAPVSLEVAESGVGLRLVGTRLEGEGDRFRPGQRVTFATRVVGGGAGESIRHVWLRDGKVEQSIRLRLGGASWRTWSTKTLGRPGAWSVEARDEQGRVLARADLSVTP